MSDSIRNYLEFRSSNDIHAHPSERMDLAECSCVQIPASMVQVGDFKYHYSSQLDAFTLCEVISVDHAAGKCQLVIIDSDNPEVDCTWPREGDLKDRHDRFYRPNPGDRERAERDGFASQYVPMFPSLCRPIQRRQLSVRLYYKPPARKVLGWLQRLFFNKD